MWACPVASAVPDSSPSQLSQWVKNPPAVLETQVRSLGQEDPLEAARHPTPVFLPGDSHGQRSLAGYSPRGRKESDTTDAPSTHYLHRFNKNVFFFQPGYNG